MQRIACTASLCLCMLTHSYLLISVFPYSGFLVIYLIESVNEENAGRYAGLVASAFMIGRALTSFVWGQVADRYGRTTVLYLSLALSCLGSMLFGLAPTFVAAVAIRFFLGLSNGIMSAIQTIISELSEADEKKEAKMMGVVIGMWGFGFLVSPAISGCLSEPINQYPDSEWLQKGMLGAVLRKHPFLLPNLLGAIMCLVSILLLGLFVPETLPAELRRSPSLLLRDGWQQLCSWIPKTKRYKPLPVLKEHDSAIFREDDTVGLENRENEDEEDALGTSQPERATMASLWKRKDTRRLLLIYWGYSFVGLTVDELFPLFCLSRQAGFGVSEKEIGKILSLCGLIFVIFQYPVYSHVYERYKLAGAVRIGSLFSAPLMFFVPISLLLNARAEAGELKLAAVLFLAFVLATHRIFSFTFFTSISVMTNRTVPTTQRATMNGLSNLGGSAAKGLGPIFAGILATFSVSLLGRFGSLLMYAVVGCFGLIVTISTLTSLQADDLSISDERAVCEEIELHATREAGLGRGRGTLEDAERRESSSRMQ